MSEEWTTALILYPKDNVDIFQGKRTGFCIDTNVRLSLRGSHNTHWELKEMLNFSFFFFFFFFSAHCVGIGANYFARLGLN